ncbi:MAG TPA: GntR family transcriptional regulator [Phycisphaeraceae bacterium]
MVTVSRFKPVSAQPGRPLYESVKEAVVDAIKAGQLQPGDRIPSTKDLSEQLNVSLVTAHRALQELVASGVLLRTQGRGTFVLDRSKPSAIKIRVGLVLHRETSLSDYYHGQILEGIRQAAREHSVDLVVLQFESDTRKECNGYLFINPLRQELEQFDAQIDANIPKLVLGARSHLSHIGAIDVDSVGLSRCAVEHLWRLGHQRIGYLGGADQLSNSRDRREGFAEACKALGVGPNPQQMLSAASWRLNEAEKMSLTRVLSRADRPTAIFAAGYYLALDIYEAAGVLGLKIPQDLSVVGVDDPPSAAHLSPPLTTMRQPLVQLGNAALTALWEAIRDVERTPTSQTLRAELVIRQSSGAPPRR